MLKKVLAAIGIGNAGSPGTGETPLDGPYKDSSTNYLYHLLFCDKPELFRKSQTGGMEPPWSTLLSNEPDLDAIAAIAGDQAQEARVRALAFNMLRTAGKPVARKEHLATIIEVRLPDGLDTLAVFADGGARYINHSGRIAIVEGTPNPFDREIGKVLEASKPIVAAIGPWDRERLPPPPPGNIRMNFLVSDGLYFGEGPMDVMQQEPLAAPVIVAATELLVKLVEQSAHRS